MPVVQSDCWLTVVLLLAATACAGSNAPRPAALENTVRHFDRVERAELEAVRDFTALQAIQQLRPRWLRGRGPSIGVAGGGLRARGGEERVRAYVDGIARDLELLDLLEADDVDSMRFLSAADATTRFGIGHGAGAIMVVTRNQ